MLFEEYLKKVRQKSKDEKNAYAFMLALGITSIIVLFWIINLMTGSGQTENVAEDSKMYLISSPFQVIRDQFKTVVENKE